MRRRPIATIAAPVVALALLAGACSGEGGPTPEQEAADDYALAVEVAVRPALDASEEAVVLLNEAADAEVEAGEAVERLDALALDVRAVADELDALAPPDAAATSAGDLRRSVEQLAGDLESAASDLRGAVALGEDPSGAAHAGGRLVLASSLGLSALSRAVRAIAGVVAEP